MRHPPTLAGLKADGIDFRGTLYAGLMLTDKAPKYSNTMSVSATPKPRSSAHGCRRSRPRIARPPGEALPDKLNFHDGAAIVVVLAAGGYPGSYAKGETIHTPNHLPERSAIVHAGTKRLDSGEIVTAGGRVLGISAQAPSLQQAADLAYSVCDQVHFGSKYLRRDIGHRELNR